MATVHVAPAPRAQPTPRPAAPTGGRLAHLAADALLTVAIGLALAVALAGAVGYRGEVVLTGSMRPAIQPGDLAIARRTAAGTLRPGDIVSFSSPSQKGVVITHRVRAVHPAPGGRLAVVTRGDANNTDERWTVRPTAVVGRVVGVVPAVGRVTHWTAAPARRVALFAGLSLLLLGWGLRWAWRA